MNVQRSCFLWLLVLAAAGKAPALGQTQAAASERPAVRMAQGAAAIPDFSGQWSHPSLPGFEPPRSGAGPVTNRVRLRNGAAELEEDACAENIREYYNNRDSDVPRADRPDF